MNGTGHYWTLLTNHGACLLLLASGVGTTVRTMADAMQITERSAARILADLRTDGYIEVRRDGRRNTYTVNLEAPLRHPIGRGHRVVDLLGGILTHIDATRAETMPEAVMDDDMPLPQALA
jgi:DNA-binding transcriptional ArsR family regulator